MGTPKTSFQLSFIFGLGVLNREGGRGDMRSLGKENQGGLSGLNIQNLAHRELRLNYFHKLSAD